MGTPPSFFSGLSARLLRDVKEPPTAFADLNSLLRNRRTSGGHGDEATVAYPGDDRHHHSPQSWKPTLAALFDCRIQAFLKLCNLLVQRLGGDLRINVKGIFLYLVEPGFVKESRLL